MADFLTIKNEAMANIRTCTEKLNKVSETLYTVGLNRAGNSVECYTNKIKATLKWLDEAIDKEISTQYAQAQQSSINVLKSTLAGVAIGQEITKPDTESTQATAPVRHYFLKLIGEAGPETEVSKEVYDTYALMAGVFMDSPAMSFSFGHISGRIVVETPKNPEDSTDNEQSSADLVKEPVENSTLRYFIDVNGGAGPELEISQADYVRHAQLAGVSTEPLRKQFTYKNISCRIMATRN